MVSCCVYERPKPERQFMTIGWPLDRYKPSSPSTEELHGRCFCVLDKEKGNKATDCGPIKNVKNFHEIWHNQTKQKIFWKFRSKTRWDQVSKIAFFLRQFFWNVCSKCTHLPPPWSDPHQAVLINHHSGNWCSWRQLLLQGYDMICSNLMLRQYKFDQC